jgi:hypothetical protein
VGLLPYLRCHNEGTPPLELWLGPATTFTIVVVGPLYLAEASSLLSSLAADLWPTRPGPFLRNLWTTGITPGTSQDFPLFPSQGLATGWVLIGTQSTHHPHHRSRYHDRAVIWLWLASLHDGKRGTCQVSQAASCLGRHQPLLDIRRSARTSATLTCGSAAFPTSRTHGKAGAFLPHRRAMPIFAMRVE